MSASYLIDESGTPAAISSPHQPEYSSYLCKDESRWPHPWSRPSPTPAPEELAELRESTFHLPALGDI